LEAKKSLDRDQKFLKIIKELDSVNRNSLKKVSELEVELDKAQTQAELYKKQAHDYYEELRANEFDRSKFQVDDKAKNFVHYFNEFAKDSDNVHAKN
jgi:Na+-transporting NADH:ubiquinone oxidoreductase subunit NqrC